MASGGSSRFAGECSLTWGDMLGCLRSVAAFAALLLAPGYCLAWACDLLGFRARAAGERLAWGVALSFGGMTIVSVLLGKYGSLTAVCWLAGICALGCVGIMACEVWSRRRGLNFTNKGWLIGAGIAAAWLLFAVVELVDIGVGSRLYFSVTVFDHALRTAFVDAVLRTGVPPANPLFWPGHAAPMRYYYFWYVLTAAAARLGSATARQAMIASVAWSGFGLAATLQLFCRNFLGNGSQRASDAPQLAIPSHSSHETTTRWMARPPRLVVALGLLAVTGLDILPVLVKALLHMPTDGDMEWWSAAQVSSWMDSLLWVPHHIAGWSAACWASCWCGCRRVSADRRRALCGLIAGLAFASAFGLSTWVALAFAMVMAAWMLWALAWERGSRARVPALLLAAAVASVALLPYLASCMGRPREQRRPGEWPDFTGRKSYDCKRWRACPASACAILFRPRACRGSAGSRGWPRRIRRRRTRPWGLCCCCRATSWTGVLWTGAAGCALGERRHRLDEAEASRTALVLAVAGLAVSTFLRSTIVENNDFAMRSVLIAQFFLLLLAVAWWEGGFASTNRFLRGAMLAMAWIGLAGTVYQAVALRVYLPVEERLGRAEVDGLAERAMAVRLGSMRCTGRCKQCSRAVQHRAAGGVFSWHRRCRRAVRWPVQRRVAALCSAATRRVPGRGAGRGAAVCGGLLARLFAGIAGAFSPGSFIRSKTPSSGGALSASQARDRASGWAWTR